MIQCDWTAAVLLLVKTFTHIHQFTTEQCNLGSSKSIAPAYNVETYSLKFIEVMIVELMAQVYIPLSAVWKGEKLSTVSLLPVIINTLDMVVFDMMFEPFFQTAAVELQERTSDEPTVAPRVVTTFPSTVITGPVEHLAPIIKTSKGMAMAQHAAIACL